MEVCAGGELLDRASSQSGWEGEESGRFLSGLFGSGVFLAFHLFFVCFFTHDV